MHFIVVRIREVKLALILMLVIVMLSLGLNNHTAASVYFGGTVRELPIYNVETENEQIAISFDAAWGATKTEDILALLKEYNVGATFFLVGFWVEDYPEMAKKIKDAGYEIGTHSNTHPDLTKLNSQQIKEELETSKSIIEDATGAQVELFRPPFGAYSNNVINIATELGLKSIQWDVDSLDWKGLSAYDIAIRVLNKVKLGSIVLFHNNADNIIDGLRLVLETLTKKGYKITSIGNLLIKDNYYIDSQGKQRKK